MSRGEPAPGWTAWLFLAASALLHVLFGWAFETLFTVPKLDLQIVVPMDVELGLTKEVSVAALPAVQSPQSDSASSPASATAAGDGDEAKPPKPKKPKKKPADKEAERDKDKHEAPDAGVESTLESANGTLPQGTQIAVRVDLTRIRNSPIADDARQLLAAIPDWQQLLDGSGIDPVQQLDRLLIATPNLERSKVVVAGSIFAEAQPQEGPSLPERAVQSLSAERQVEAPWREQEGVRVAPWANRDATPRIIAVLDPLHFAIAREEDLPRVLAIASARASDEARLADGGVPKSPAEALLSMGEGEGLSLEVDGVERFVPKPNAGIPQRLRLSAVEIAEVPPRLSLRLELAFADPERAAAGLRFWDKVRRFYGSNVLIAMLGLAAPLQSAVLETSESTVRATVELSVEQTRMVMGYVRELISPTPPPPPP